jgi:malto-oligosyltrehalose trehalohydrolase
MKRQHRMPFGAEVLADGAVRFRLWAPAATAVAVVVDSDAGAQRLPMRALDHGWHVLETPLASAGSRYRFEVNGRLVPDPASRCNPDDVHQSSEVVDPAAFCWEDAGWRGRAWEEAIIYELHVGSFSPEGSFAGVTSRLDHLQRLGVTALELLPVADFAGRRNWGYDGVLLYAPDSSYGRPDDLKELVQQAHARGLMVFLDVVYNHFGPDGNYLAVSAPQFFTARHATPWGEAIDFDGPDSRPVRDFFIHNALYWLEEYHLDGLRLDAIHAIRDASVPDFVTELVAAVRGGPGATRPIHLILENVRNEAHRLARAADGAPLFADAQWNDDFHHAMHVLLTGERDGYYGDYADDPVAHLGRCLAEGFAYQGERSAYRRGSNRGEPSRQLPPSAFVNALQTHDQVGNRAFGERLSQLVPADPLRAAVAICLLSPSPPMLFMGEEFAAREPFGFFCDFRGDLARGVRAGRIRYHGRFRGFDDPAVHSRIPDPSAAATFAASQLDWSACGQSPHADWLAFYTKLLALRRRTIVPLLRDIGGDAGRWDRLGAQALQVAWRVRDGRVLTLVANLGPNPCAGPPLPPGEVIYRTDALALPDRNPGVLPPWSVAWFVTAADGRLPDQPLV